MKTPGGVFFFVAFTKVILLYAVSIVENGETILLSMKIKAVSSGIQGQPDNMAFSFVLVSRKDIGAVMGIFKLGKRKSIEERKIALINQLSQLKTEMTNMGWQHLNDYNYASARVTEHAASSYYLNDISGK